jgi:predicted membrane-bound spermidine synthase
MLVLYGALLAVPLPFLLGGVLPGLFRLAAPTGRSLPARTGLLYLANSVGAFGGALLVQFLGFPVLGTKGVVLVLALAGTGAGAWCLLKSGGRTLAYGLVTPAIVLLALLVPASVWDIYTFGLTGPAVEQVEGVSGVAVIRWQPDGGRVFVNGQYMSSLPDDPRHVQLVSFALALPRRETILVLGLGGGGMVRELVRDPAVRRVDVVDWSHELPRLLESPRARPLLDGALQDPKVRLCRCDARVVVSLHEAGVYDVVIDNLAEASWVGASGIKSEAYFRQVRRVLKPAGILVYKANYATARAAILAGLAATFRVVREHPRGIVLAADEPIAIDPGRVDEVLAWRGPVIGASTPYADWLVGALRPISRADLPGVEPIRDDLLIYEYTLDPLRSLRGAGRSRGQGSAGPTS